MYILSTRPINFPFGNGYGSISSAGGRLLSTNRIWRNGRQEVAPHHSNNYRISARRGKSKLPHVYTGNIDGFEVPPFNENTRTEESIKCIKKMLKSIGDGSGISVSAYDTAWLALIKGGTSSNLPRFPRSLEWVVSNQLGDGSWGDADLAVACDRLLSTLACVVALKTWNVHPNKIEKGVLFVKDNISKLGDDDVAHTTFGFEILFPAFIERARNLGIEGLPYDAPVMQETFVARDQKFERISKGLKGKVPSSMLLILEGLNNLEWENIMKLQSPNGSFVASPSTTAFVFMETKDENCLRYITKTTEIFGGGAPSLYPVDFLTRLKAVDMLQRLGISQFFHSEIEDFLSYIYRFWTGNGVFNMHEKSIGFRLLRLHGYNINPNEFINFKKDDDEMVGSPSTMLNLYRASQLLFPEEAILEEAKEYSQKYLQERQLTDQLLDRRLISKNLHTEIKYGLETPWYAGLPRLDARFFIEHYSVDEVWIGKSLYRFTGMKKDTCLELAKLDYNRCQEQHRMEWDLIEKWYEDCNLDEFGISKKNILEAHFLAAASIFEAERSGERVAWVKSQIIAEILSTYYFIKQSDQISHHKTEFSTAFTKKIQIGGDCGKGFKNVQRIITILFEALTQLKKNAREQTSDGDVSDDLLHEAWGGWLKKLGEGSGEEIQDIEVIVRTINICGGHILSKEVLSHHEYKSLSQLTNQICHHLLKLENEKTISMEIEKEMQLLVQLVMQDSSNNISTAIKQTFLVVAKTFYHRAYFSAQEIEEHISMILFQQVV